MGSERLSGLGPVLDSPAYLALRAPRGGGGVAPGGEADERLIDQLLQEVDHAAAQKLDGKTLRDVVSALEEPRLSDSETAAEKKS